MLETKEKPIKEDAIVESTPFQLSRVYARGWSAGKVYQEDEDTDLKAVAERLSPYPSSEERTRWIEGFMAAISHARTTPARIRNLQSPKGE